LETRDYGNGVKKMETMRWKLDLIGEICFEFRRASRNSSRISRIKIRAWPRWNRLHSSRGSHWDREKEGVFQRSMGVRFIQMDRLEKQCLDVKEN